ncbi:hypothetical protein HMPREF0208_04731, partial [Citrobacter koseri]
FPQIPPVFVFYTYPVQFFWDGAIFFLFLYFFYFFSLHLMFKP